MTAAAQLQGLTLEDGWLVFERIERSENATGGTFSHSYLAKKGSRIAFVKAFDFSSAFEPGADTLGILNLLTASYKHERDVLEYCRGRRLSKVAVAIGHGHVSVPNMGAMEGRVYYLLFEKADGDIRTQMDVNQASDAFLCMVVLRQVCLGLWQIHREFIAHQDLKPSNVLCYRAGEVRISDFGRSSRRSQAIWHDEQQCPGDRTYAPPELLYGYLAPDFVPRRVGADLYMLGNLAAFLFTGVNVTASLMAMLNPQLHWTSWNGTYHQVLPYLQEAFGRFLQEFETRLENSYVRSQVLPLVRQLCNPDLDQRGHPKGLRHRSHYSLERYVSHLTNVTRMIEIKTRATHRP